MATPSGELRPLEDVLLLNHLVLLQSPPLSAGGSGSHLVAVGSGGSGGEPADVRSHPDVQRALEAFWTTSSDGTAVGEAAYLAAHVRIQKAMEAEFDEAEATELAAEEFEGEMACLDDEAAARRALGRAAFATSVCEIAEQWVSEADAARYAYFLGALHSRVCGPTGELRPSYGDDVT